MFKFASVLLTIFVLPPIKTNAQSIDAMMMQNRMQMMALDAQMNAEMQQNEMKMQGMMKNYIDENRDSLEQELQAYTSQTGQQMTLEQYARNKVNTEAARRNAAANPQTNPIFEQQKRMFQQGQAAHAQRQKNFDTYNNNWQQNQQQIDNSNQAWRNQQKQIDNSNSRFIQQGIQGNQFYRNNQTGEVAELPFAGSPGIYQNNENTWTSDSMGEYKQIDPQYGPQEMEAYDPNYGDDE